MGRFFSGRNASGLPDADSVRLLRCEGVAFSLDKNRVRLRRCEDDAALFDKDGVGLP
jgi:hypothetical protein